MLHVQSPRKGGFMEIGFIVYRFSENEGSLSVVFRKLDSLSVVFRKLDSLSIVLRI